MHVGKDFLFDDSLFPDATRQDFLLQHQSHPAVGIKREHDWMVRLLCDADLPLFSLYSAAFMLLLFTVENGLLRFHLCYSQSFNEIPSQPEKAHCRQ